jgi:hypothetical protein
MRIRIESSCGDETKSCLEPDHGRPTEKIDDQGAWQALRHAADLMQIWKARSLPVVAVVAMVPLSHLICEPLAMGPAIAI